MNVSSESVLDVDRERKVAAGPVAEMDCESEEFEELRKEVRRLHTALPKTSDGVTVVPGMTVWHCNADYPMSYRQSEVASIFRHGTVTVDGIEESVRLNDEAWRCGREKVFASKAKAIEYVRDALAKVVGKFDAELDAVE